jgi:galactose-1-phosphate uridylyltransferase
LNMGKPEADIQDIAAAVRPKDSNVWSCRRCEGVVIL